MSRRVAFRLAFCTQLLTGGGSECVAPCARDFRCDPLRCSETIELGAQQLLLWSWDLSELLGAGWGAGGAEMAVDYTFHALDESLIAAAVVNTESVRQVVDKLKRNKRHTGDDVGWLLPDSSCDDRPTSCSDHPALGSFRPTSAFSREISLVVLCKNKNKNDPPCKLMYAPPAIELRHVGKGAHKRVLPTAGGGGDAQAAWQLPDLGTVKKYLPFLNVTLGLPELSGLVDPSKWSLPKKITFPTFLAAEARQQWAASASKVGSSAVASGRAVVVDAFTVAKARMRIPTLSFDRVYWKATFQLYGTWVVDIVWESCIRLGSSAQVMGLNQCSRLTKKGAANGVSGTLQLMCEKAFAPEHARLIGVLLVSNGLLLLLWFWRHWSCCCGCGGRVDDDFGGEDGHHGSPPRRSHAYNPTYALSSDEYHRRGDENANAEVAKLVRTPEFKEWEARRHLRS